jgi:hypothetical protein
METLFSDLGQSDQDTVVQQMAAANYCDTELMRRAMQKINPIVDEDMKVTWVGFCFIRGYVVSVGIDPDDWEVLQSRQLTCRSDFNTYAGGGNDDPPL